MPKASDSTCREFSAGGEAIPGVGVPPEATAEAVRGVGEPPEAVAVPGVAPGASPEAVPGVAPDVVPSKAAPRVTLNYDIAISFENDSLFTFQEQFLRSLK